MTQRLIVFDLDGTLIDSRRDLADSINALLVEAGGGALPEETVGAMVGDGAPVLVRRALAAAGLALDPADALQRFLAIYERRLLHHTRPYPGLVEALEQASSRSCALAVLTNKPRRATHQILEGLQLAHFFFAVLGGDGPFQKKPDPAGLTHLMDRAHAAAAETMLVGDSPIDRDTARRAGVRFCLARYGFGVGEDRGLDPGDVAIDSPGELTRLLTELSSS